MFRKSSYSLLWLLFFSAPLLWAAPWDQSLSTKDGDEIAEAFLKVRTLIPSLSEGAINYGIDPVGLFAKQEITTSLMTQNEEYQKLRPSHRELLQFQILEGQVTVTDERSKNWKLWVERSQQIVGSRGLTDLRKLTAEIIKSVSSPLLGKSQGIVVGVAQLMPGPLKKDFFSAAPEVKVQMMKAQLPAEIVSQGFAPSRLGWSDAAISKDEIILRYQQALALEQGLTVLMVNHYSRVESTLSSAKDYLQKWNVEANLKKSLDNWFQSQVIKLIPQEKAQASVTMTLREVPPVVGLFRGFAGNDCATKFSFPFVNSPNEYTFLVYDGKGFLKGYVQGTKVVADGRSAFYLHTITGPRLSRKDTFEIMSVIEQEKARFGSVEVVLPLSEKTAELINFLPVRQAIQEASQDRKVPLVYQDSHVRAVLKTEMKITHGYDDPDKNIEARRLDLQKLSKVEVRVVEAPGLESVSSHVEKNTLLGILVQLGRHNVEQNKKIVRALAKRVGLATDDVQDLVKQSKNVKALPVREFLVGFVQTAERHGFSIVEEDLMKGIGLVAKGLLQSPDLIKNTPVLKSVMNNLIELREFSELEKFLSQNMNLLNDLEFATKFLKSYYNDFHNAEGRDNFAETTLKYNPDIIMKNNEVLAAISLSAKGKTALVSYLRAHPNLIAELKGNVSVEPVLKEIRMISDFFEEAARKLRTLRTEEEYKKALVMFETRFGTFDEGKEFARGLLSVTADHYLSLNPKSTQDYVFHLLHPARKYHPTLRRLAPAFMRAESLREVNIYLGAFVELKEGGLRGVPEALLEGLQGRSGIEKLNLSDLPPLAKMPEVNWNQLKALRCESLF